MKNILKYRTVSALFLLSFLLVLGSALWAYFALTAIGAGPFILHFNDMVGITSVGDITTVIGVGILGVAIVVMNFFIGMELEERDVFLGKMLAIGTLIFSILLFIGFAAIINVN